MHTKAPLMDELAKITTAAMGLAQAASEEAKTAFRAQGDRLVAEFDLVGKRLDDAGEAFKRARHRLTESNQAVIPRARRLAELGARGRKALTEELRPEAELRPGAPALRLIGAAVDASDDA